MSSWLKKSYVWLAVSCLGFAPGCVPPGVTNSPQPGKSAKKPIDKTGKTPSPVQKTAKGPAKTNTVKRPPTTHIESVKIGRSRRIPRHALDNYVARLMADRGERESGPAA